MSLESHFCFLMLQGKDLNRICYLREIKTQKVQRNVDCSRTTQCTELFFFLFFCFLFLQNAKSYTGCLQQQQKMLNMALLVIHLQRLYRIRN